MKKLWGCILVFAVLLTGCRSASVLSFDVWRPAKVTFPADSTTYRLAEYIALELSDAHYFPEITIFYDDSITLPKSLYPLLSENQLSIVRGGADNTAVVSLDKTDMVVNMEDHTLLGSSGETVFVTDLSVATTLNLRVYWPNKIEPSSEMVTDTLYWQSFGYTPDEAHSSLPLTAEFIQEAMRQISARVRELFIPHVDNVNRYIYTSTNPAMDDAYDFWQQKKYKEASYLWEYVYEEQKNETTRAMAAANLAVYNELFDNYKVAIEWVDKSLSLFEKRVDSNASDITALRDYRRQLMERKSDNSLLQKQM